MDSLDLFKDYTKAVEGEDREAGGRDTGPRDHTPGQQPQGVCMAPRQDILDGRNNHLDYTHSYSPGYLFTYCIASC